MLVIPTRPLPNQTLQAQINGQPCTLNIYQFAYGLFMDVYVGQQLIAAGVLCENRTLVVRYAYAGLVGDFVFVDTQGTSDPAYTGLGTRFLLFYLAPSDLAAGQG
jgi:hypothetical protein